METTKLKVGDTVLCYGNMRNPNPPTEDVVVVVGRKWATLGSGRLINAATMKMHHDDHRGGDYFRSETDRVSAIAEDNAQRERRMLWDRIRHDIPHLPPDRMTTDQIRAFAEVMGCITD